MNEEKPTETPASTLDLAMIETLAFALLRYDLIYDTERVEDTAISEVADSGEGAREPAPGDLQEETRSRWQSHVGLRKAYRRRAQAFMETLDGAGARIRSSDAKQVVKHLEWIKTVPPRAAYSDDELAP